MNQSVYYKHCFKRCFGWMLLAGFVISCGPKTFDTESAMWAYLKNPDNGYLQSKTVNDVAYTFCYKPTDLIVQQFLDTVSKAEIAKLRAQYSKYLYFTLSISKGGRELLAAAQNRQEFGRRVQLLSFEMERYVHLYAPKKDTISLLGYSAPRLYGMAPATNMLFVYPKKEMQSEHLIFAVEDFGLMTGALKFKIPTAKIKNQPFLTFEHSVAKVR